MTITIQQHEDGELHTVDDDDKIGNKEVTPGNYSLQVQHELFVSEKLKLNSATQLLINGVKTTKR